MSKFYSKLDWLDKLMDEYTYGALHLALKERDLMETEQALREAEHLLVDKTEQFNWSKERVKSLKAEVKSEREALKDRISGGGIAIKQDRQRSRRSARKH